MTLTTERLREIAEDGFLEHGDAKLMARELLANREAQPVRLPDDLEPNTEPCVICGVVSSHPEGWHYCHPKCGEGDA
ncbi:TPA: hypothetical protein ACKQGF_000972 [Serratia marcescens]